MHPQVLIVGAGPIGLTMAVELARYGIPLRIVDKAPHRSDKSKALVLWSRTLELLDRAGIGQVFVAAGHKVVAAHIVAAGHEIGRIGLDAVQSPHPYALMLPQSDTERLLEEHLASLGIQVERQVELAALTQDVAGVAATLRHQDGAEEKVAAAYLIGCDGAHSTVRHVLGLPFEGDTLNSDWILADVHVTGYPFPDTEMATYWHHEGALVIFPITPGRYRIIADLGRSHGDMPAAPTLEQVQSVITARGPAAVRVADPIWLSAFRINERKVAEYRAGRVFVAGDAAHVHSPAGGQGMNTGMQDAFNLAWKLALVCRGSCGENLLDSYSIERNAVGEEVLKAAGRLTAIGVLRNPVAQAARNLAGLLLLGLAPVRHAAVEQMTEVSIGYVDSPLNGPHAASGPQPGTRMAPGAGQAPVGAGGAPRFALFAAPSDALVQVQQRYAQVLEPELRPPAQPGAVTLVRPDGYTACNVKSDDTAVVDAYLAAVFLAASK